MMRQALSALVVVLLFVVSCGGGEGDTAAVQSANDREPTCLFSADEEILFHQPENYHYLENLCSDGSVVSYFCRFPGSDSTIIFSAGDDEGSLDNICKELQSRETGIPVGVSEYNECVNADDLLIYFNSFSLDRFTVRPEVSLAEGTTDFQKNIVWRAVKFLNASLPDDYKIRIRPEYIPARSGKPPSGEIYIDFAPKEEWQDVGNSDMEDFIALANSYSSSDELSVHIWVDPQYIQIRFLKGEDGFEERVNRNERDANNIALLSHELLHALGFSGHVFAQTFGSITFASVRSIMVPYAQITGTSATIGETRIRVPFKIALKNGLLPEADRAGLRYLYEELEPGDSSQSIEEADLDAWLVDKGCFSQ